MFEFSPKSKLALGLVVLSGLGGTACGGGAQPNETTPPKSKAAPTVPKAASTPQVAYANTGLRFVLVPDVNKDLGLDNDNGYLLDIVQWCDGKNLEQQTIGSGTTGTSMSTTPNFPACIEYGRLTIANFPPSPSEQVITSTRARSEIHDDS